MNARVANKKQSQNKKSIQMKEEKNTFLRLMITMRARNDSQIRNLFNHDMTLNVVPAHIWI